MPSKWRLPLGKHPILAPSLSSAVYNSAILKDTAETTYQIEALYFDLVYARSSDRTTNDTVDVDALAYNLIRSGTW